MNSDLLRCPECGQPCPSAVALDRHLAAAHGITGTPPASDPADDGGSHLTCPDCGATFHTQLALDYHRGGVHSVKAPDVAPEYSDQDTSPAQLSFNRKAG